MSQTARPQGTIPNAGRARRAVRSAMECSASETARTQNFALAKNKQTGAKGQQGFACTAAFSP